MSTTVILFALAFATGLMNAAFAAGGNILLILGMAGFFPAGAVIPVHGATVLSSHIFRATLEHAFIRWRMVFQLLAGSAIAIAMVTPLVPLIPARYFPLLLGGFILVAVWMPNLRLTHRLPVPFFLCGLLQGAATMFIGPTGPLLMLFFLDAGLNKDEIVATMSTALIGSECLKIAGFLAMDFDFSPYLPLIGWMIAGIFGGTLAGRAIRHHCPEQLFRAIIKWIITALALRLLFS